MTFLASGPEYRSPWFNGALVSGNRWANECACTLQIEVKIFFSAYGQQCGHKWSQRERTRCFLISSQHFRSTSREAFQLASNPKEQQSLIPCQLKENGTKWCINKSNVSTWKNVQRTCVKIKAADEEKNKIAWWLTCFNFHSKSIFKMEFPRRQHVF